MAGQAIHPAHSFRPRSSLPCLATTHHRAPPRVSPLWPLQREFGSRNSIPAAAITSGDIKGQPAPCLVSAGIAASKVGTCSCVRKRKSPTCQIHNSWTCLRSKLQPVDRKPYVHVPSLRSPQFPSNTAQPPVFIPSSVGCKAPKSRVTTFPKIFVEYFQSLTAISSLAPHPPIPYW